MSNKISTCLILNNRAEEAANFYVSLFGSSRILDITRVGPGSFLPQGSVLAVVFELDGAEFMILNHGPDCVHSEAASIVAKCDGQSEIDRLWTALSDGGEQSRCGWLKDRFGVSWQIIPENLGELLGGEPEAAGRVFAAVMEMGKLDVARMEAARAGQHKEEIQ